MAYTTTLTNVGKELLRTALMGEGIIKFVNLKMGDGTPPADATALTDLVHPVTGAIAPIAEMTRDANYFVRIEARFNNSSVDTGFFVKELGLFAVGSDDPAATPVLYAYVGITDGDGGYVPPNESILIERDYTISVFVGDAVDVSAETQTAGYATLNDLAAHNTSSTAHENRFVLKQDRTDLLNSANALTDDSVIPVYIPSGSNSGHKKSVLTTLVNFIKTKLSSGDASFLPIIPVTKGGTGKSTLTQNGVLIGNAQNGVIVQASSRGAFYATESNARPTFGVLPANCGGTGNNTGYIRAGLKSGVTAGSKATAEGQNGSPTGSYSHTEGTACVAYGDQSHAEGNGTIANSRSQHVFGEYNVADTQNKSGQANYAEIVGGGTASARKNIRTLKWDGTEEIAGSFLPSENNTKDIGSSTKKWKNIFATTLYGILSKKVTFNNSGSGAASGALFDGGSADVVVSYNTLGAAAASHNHTPAQINSNGTLGAFVSAKASTPLGNAYVRNIYAGTTDMTPGTTSLAYGTIYLVYE